MELMVVLALIGILSAIGLPSFLASLPEKRLKNAARNLYADMQRARLQAVKENANAFVQFTPADGSYALYIDDDGDGSLDTAVDRLVTQVNLTDYGAVDYGCNATGTNWNNNDLPSDGVSFAGGVNFTGFSNTGTAGAGSVYLQSQNDQEVCYAMTVTNYGAVKLRRFSGSSWE